MADPRQPSSKRRKHCGIRFGAPSAAQQQDLPATVQQAAANTASTHGQHNPRQAINHHHVERAKAEAQLQGRRFQLNTSSCTLPDQDQLFSSLSWALPEMMTEKEKLNNTKSLLDCKDIK